MSDYILSAAQKDDVAFASLVEQYRPLLESMTQTFYSRGRQLGLDREELFQEATIALYNALSSFNQGQKDVTFGLYAKICIRNRLVSILRHANRAKAVARPDPGPSEREAAKVRLAQLRARVEDKLTHVENIALNGYLAGHSYREIADLLGCDTKTVDNALWRVKKKMKQEQGK